MGNKKDRYENHTIALAGKFLLNLARTIPVFPWERVTFPQMHL